MPDIQETIYEITMRLTEKQLQLMRNAVSDLGTDNTNCAIVQLQLADAILDKKIFRKAETKKIDRCKDGTCNCAMH